MQERLARQIAFLVEADRLKSVIRRTPLVDVSRLENSAEHSWHLVLVIMVMREYGPPHIDWTRVMEMVAVHDLVEIDAGDVSAYDVEALAAKAQREQVAADRIFGLLPPDQQHYFRQLWDEFEAHATTEARFANAVDRLQPLIQNAHASGGSWRGQTLVRARVLGRMAPIEKSLPDVWPYVLDVVESFCASGILLKD
jgi:putative hydrolase of HD superfamily